MTLFLAMTSVLAVWSLHAVLFSGIGLLTRRLVAIPAYGPRLLGDAFWIGLATTLLILQFWHLWAPVGKGALSLIAGLGVLGLVLQREALTARVRRFRPSRRAGWLLLPCAAALVWLANQAVGPTSNYDTGLYHLQAIRWAEAYPLIPGLGNLHGRLAFNNSSWLFSALIDAGPLPGRTLHLGNGLLLAVLLVQGLRGLTGLLRRRGRLLSADGFSAALLPPVLWEAVSGNAAAAAPDTVVLALLAAATRALLPLADGPGPRGVGHAAALFSVCLLAAAAVTVKLSAAVYAILAIALAGFLYLRRRPTRPVPTAGASGPAFAAIAAVILLILPWIGRGVLLSGYPLYPSTLFPAAVDWRVPRAAVVSIRNWTLSWARQPGPHWSRVLGNRSWVRPWLTRVAGDAWRFSVPLALAGLCAVIALRRWRLIGPPGHRPAAPWLLLIPPSGGLLFWLVTAPDPRFGFFTLWMLGAVAAGLSVRGACAGVGRRWVGIAAATLLVPLGMRAASSWHGPGPDQGFHPPPVTELRTGFTGSGLFLYATPSPQKRNQCWDAPLPCTPYPHPHLRLRREGDLAAGFRVEPFDEEAFVGMHP